MLRAQFLPQGMDTPGHNFFAVRDAGTQVGGLWFMVDESEGARIIFVVDIQIFEGFRRRGHGSVGHGFDVVEKYIKSQQAYRGKGG